MVDEFNRITALSEDWGEGRTLAVFAPSAPSEQDRIGRGIFERSAASPPMARILFEMVTETDVGTCCPASACRRWCSTATRSSYRSKRAPPGRAHPGARLVVMPGADHIPFYGDADGYAEEIEEFLTGAATRRPPIASSPR